MINEVSGIQNRNYLLNNSNKTNNLAFCSGSKNEKGDRFEKSKSYLGFSKTSIWTGIATAALTFGLMLFSNKKFSNKLWKFEDWNPTFFPTPVIIGGAATLITELINNFSAAPKDKK